MPAAEPTRPSDDFWLTAHDGVHSSSVLGERPLGIGLATGLLAELVHGDWCHLWDGELYRTTADPPSDRALLALLGQMEAEEQDWPLRPMLVPARAQTYVAAHARGGRPERTRPAGRGHRVREWIPFLANKERALRLIGDRLVPSGLVWRQERGRVFRTVRYMPRDRVVTAIPASNVCTAVQRMGTLPWSGLVLAGLFLATGLDQHALFSLTPSDRDALRQRLSSLDAESRELLLAAENAVRDAAAIR